MSTISLLYDGYEIIQDTIIADATFESQADGRPGTCHFRVKDAGNIDGDEYGFPSNRVPPGTFKTGLGIELRIDNVLVWSGATTIVSRAYAFPAENTADPGDHQRFWVVEGVDWNILFTRRVVWNVSNPTERVPEFTGTENDGDVVKLIMSQYMDLSGDGISDVGVVTIGPLSPYGEAFNAADVGDMWGRVMDRIVASNGAIYYIDPDRVLQYRDAEVVSAPFPLSDQPALTAQAIGYRDMSLASSAIEMANDALVWGAGGGSELMVFARVEDAPSIAEHGRFQWGDFRSDMWLSDTVERRAESYVYGSPTSRRGHKDDHDQIVVTIFEPTYRVGQVVNFINNTFDYQDDVPIRQMRITFPTPTDAMFTLQLSHRIDLPFFMVDPYPQIPSEVPPFDEGWISEMIPVPVASPGFGFPFAGAEIPIENVMVDVQKFISVNEDGQFLGDGGGVYSSVGIKNGFLANIPFNQSICGGVGPGAYNKYEDREQWQRMLEPGLTREAIVANQIDYEVRIGEKDIEGHVPAIQVRVAYGDPAVGRFGDGTLIGVIQCSDPDLSDDALAPTRSVEFGSVVVPSELFDSDEEMWLVVAPAWEAERGGYYCDPFYNGGPLVCQFRGPRCTGEGVSGVVSLTAFTLDSGPVFVTRSNPSSGGVVFTGTDGTATFYRTQYPYITGSLTVTWQGTSATDAQEVDPPNGLFSLPADIRDQTENIIVTYRRADIVVTPFPNMGVPPQEPGEPYTPPPSVTDGQTYRPANQRQFGWGTIFDSTNCNMACAAMALDRHSLGRYTRYRGSPQNTPPSMRFYSGSNSLAGTGHDETVRAWDNGWNENWITGGPMNWSIMVANIQSGRGCTVFGRYAYMDSRYKKSRTYNGPHAIYINEQLGDGSFWGYDPIVGYPIVYPYYVLRTYAESYYGFVGRVTAGFTRVTPKI